MSNSPINALADVTFKTEGVPTLYSNHASPSLSFNDIRIYFNELAPKELAAMQTTSAKSSEAVITPRLCVVVSPEFARALAQSLEVAVAKYESVFGPLRIAPTQEQFTQKLGG
jgi:hypothetical protein